MNDPKLVFINQLLNVVSRKTFVKMVFSKPAIKEQNSRKIVVKLISVKKQELFNSVYENKTQTITKNYNLVELENETKSCFESFKNIVIFSTEGDYSLLFNKKMEPKFLKQKASFLDTQLAPHDRKKKRFINPESNLYLERLNVTTKDGVIVHKMQDKFKQINKYIEVVDRLVKSSGLIDKSEIYISDMGSGKGYLTFALYDYLQNELNKTVYITGIEYRKDLVDKCNSIAKEVGFGNLQFIQGTIKENKIKKIDLLIALHACNTATDDAIAKGIKLNSSVIVTAPCCHKQIRKEFHVDNILSEITTYGILEERQAEMVTDTIRALFLESEGYKTDVFEFIADVHTHKNVMITAVKKNNKIDASKYLQKIEELKKMFGVKVHYLQTLFK